MKVEVAGAVCGIRRSRCCRLSMIMGGRGRRRAARWGAAPGGAAAWGACRLDRRSLKKKTGPAKGLGPGRHGVGVFKHKKKNKLKGRGVVGGAF